MPQFYYKAINKEGNITKGKINKDSKEEALDFLKSNSYTPIQIKKVNIFNKDLKEIRFNNKIKTKELAVICKQLAFIFSSGISVSTGINLILKKSKNKTITGCFYKINESVLKGDSFSKAMEEQKEMPSLLINMLKVSEASGTIPEIMLEMSDYYEQQFEKIEKIVSSLIYPLIVAFFMTLVVIYAIIFLVPAYIEMFKNSDVLLPLPTRILINISSFLNQNYLIVLLLIFIAILLVLNFIKSYKARYFFDYCLVNLFFIRNIYCKTISYRFAKVMSILHRSGVQITESLKIIKTVINNKIIDKEMDSIILKVSQGESLSSSMESCKYFDDLLISMMQIGEETGYLSESMINCNKYLEYDLDSISKKIDKLIEPFFTMVLGIVLAFIMLALILPTFTLSNIF